MEADIARRALLALAVLGAASLAACGGGGDGGSGGSSGGIATTGGTTGGTAGGSSTGGTTGGSSGGGALNQGLPGTLYFDTAQDYVGLDLGSGIVTALRPRGTGNTASYDATPSADASAFALVQFTPLSGSTGDNEVDSILGDGSTNLRIEEPQTLGDPAKLSPDRTKLIVDWYDQDQGETCCIATVFDTASGKVLQRFQGYTDWDWLPNGGLLLVKGDSIYSTDAALGTPRLLKQFAGDTPDYVASSPDGSRVAFDLGSASQGKNHVYTMNIDGSGAQQLSASALNEDGASWSADGKYIALRYAVPYSAIFGGVAGVSCPTVYILPSNAANVKLDAADPSPAFAVRQAGGGTACAFTVPNWRTTPAALPSAAGTAPTGSGSNAGLGGKLLYASDGTARTLSLADGTLGSLPVSGSVSSPYYSFDGTLLAFVQGATITIDNAGGAAASSFTGAQPFLDPPKIAPGNQSLAVRYLGGSGKSVVGTYAVDGAAGPGFTGATGYSWLPDGRLALSSQNVVAQTTDAKLGTLAAVKSLPDAASGLAASPDGSTLAFAMAGHIWTMHGDGTALKQLTVSGGEEALPAWSPDGKYLAVQYAATCPTLVAVPADGMRVFVGNAAVPTSALPLSGGGKPVCANSDVSWR